MKIATLGLIIFFLVRTYLLSQGRYFDSDEYAYLYWASHIHMGLKPYVDFLLYPAPGIFALLTPIVSLCSSIAVFAVARTSMFVVYVFLLISLAVLFWEVRRSWIALLVPLILLVLPLPQDKFIEIRPDTFAMMLFVFGLWGQMRVMNDKRFSIILVGILYAAALVVSQKMMINVGIVLLGFVGWIVFLKKSWKLLLPIGIGMAGIGMVTMVYLLSLGNFPMVWYSLTKLSFEASSLGKQFPIHPTQFFYPNDVYYGTSGVHLGYILNLVVWTGALLLAVLRLLTPFVPNGRKGVFQELVIAILFLSSFFLYCFVLPMKHSQYLIPSAVFVAWYGADFVFLLWEYFKHTNTGKLIFFVLYTLFLFVLFQAFLLVNTPKQQWTNSNDLNKIQTIWNTIPFSEPIVDMVGLTMRYPQPYSAPVLPIGQIAPIISYPVPSLIAALEKTTTTYIYSGSEGRFKTLSTQDQQYIQTHFRTVGDGMWVRVW